jgi:hypothetical protein
MSLPFIKIQNDTLDLIHVPTITSGKNIPVISCIGTSRDGKSTLLDFYCDWVIRNNGSIGSDDLQTQSPRPRYPFPTSNGIDPVTSGIDFYQVADKCLLVDCQGMQQFSDAKHDHLIALICYQISNLIILTVRQRLDLQVLNNLLSMFSFLPQIEQKFRRMDRPRLILRIKDSPHDKEMKRDPKFLDHMVERWLRKTGDQYDAIKQAFVDAFEIHVIATSYPVDPDPDQDSDSLNIYSEKFSAMNPSFVAACQHIHRLSEKTTTCELMRNGKKLGSLVQSLNKNPNICYKKLDLYYNIVTNELLEYSKQHILVYPFIDHSICDKMDGSFKGSVLYLERLDQIKELEHHTLNIKFKDVPNEMKQQKLGPYFANITGHMESARKKNILLAEDIVSPYWRTFRKKFDGTSFEKKIQGFIEIFVDREREFLKGIESVDHSVQTKYIDLLVKEKQDLEKKQSMIIKKNEKITNDINQRVREYQMDVKITSKIIEQIDQINVHNAWYNQKPECIERKIRKDIVQVLTNMYEELNHIRFLGDDQNIWKQLTYVTPREIDQMISDNSDLLGKPMFNELYYESLHHRLMEIGFLRDVDYTKIPGIRFVEFVIGDEVYPMVEEFYSERFRDVLEQIMEKHPYITVTIEEMDENVRKVYAVLKSGTMCPIIGPNKRAMILGTLQYIIMEKMIRFCHTNGLQIV